MPYSERFTFPVGARTVFDTVVVFRRLCLSKSKSMLKSKACNKRPLSGCLGVDGGAGSTVTVTEQGYIRRGRGWLKPMGGSHVIVELRPCLFPMRCSQRRRRLGHRWRRRIVVVNVFDIKHTSSVAILQPSRSILILVLP